MTGRNDADSNTRNSGVTNNGAEDLNEGIRRFQGEGHRETANEKKAAEERAKERTVGDSQFSQANENFRKVCFLKSLSLLHPKAERTSQLRAEHQRWHRFDWRAHCWPQITFRL